MKNTTSTGGAVATTTCAFTRVWRDRPATHRVVTAAATAPVQGTTLPVIGSGLPIADNYMDVHPFRTGRPPV